MTRKCQRLIYASNQKADDLAVKVEISSDFKLLKESNIIRNELKEVKSDISVLDKKLVLLKKDLSEI